MKKFVSACYRALKSPWTFLILSLVVIVIGLFDIGKLGSSFHVDSGAAGFILGMGFELLFCAFDLLPPTPEKDK